MWQMFRQYHYLNGSLGAGVRCYVAKYQDRPVAFIAVVHTRMKRNYYRVSRLVVLPDYQGIGVGSRLLNFIAELYTSQTKIPFYLVTSNPQLVRGRLKNWEVKRFGHGSHGRSDSSINRELKDSNSRKRLSVSLQYVPKSENRHSILRLER
jgi:GNAT superfamily N-acetyltransferase